ncbi:MAG: hypothetical protein M1419_08435, partial [Bacteroidetes bacterium]|nr:hypothetical protein [Bacteroidota bacterium]
MNAQTTENTDEEVNSEEYVNPYHKFIGLGPMLGSNTIVETYSLSSGKQNESHEGLFIYGGSLYYGLLDYCILEATYLYSVNKKNSNWPSR